MRGFLRHLAYSIRDCVEDRGIRVFGDLHEDALYVSENYYSVGVEDSPEMRKIAEQVFFGEWDERSKLVGRYLLAYDVNLRKFKV